MDFAIGAVNEFMIEFACPECGNVLGGFANPLVAEIQDPDPSWRAIPPGDLGAQEEKWRSLFSTRTGPWPESLGSGSEPVSATLTVRTDARADWLVLSANSAEIHRELAAEDDIEPAPRLLAYLRARYAERLRAFNPWPAFEYLAGDSLSATSRLMSLLQNLPERDGGATERQALGNPPPPNAGPMARLEWRAKLGDADAMYWLGTELKDSDPDTARRWLEDAAELGNPSAMFALGSFFRFTDPKIARTWLEQAAAHGDANAMSNLGLLLQESDPAAADDWAEAAAVKGDTDAAFNRGAMLTKLQQPHAARAWFERAAAAGDGRAAYNIGLDYKESDVQLAKEWFERAARLGEVEAMAFLGYYLMEDDPDQAMKWLARAADAGDKDAMVNCGVLAQRQARKWFEKAAAAGDNGALANLAYLLRGLDTEASKEWANRAVASGDPDLADTSEILFPPSAPVSDGPVVPKYSNLTDRGAVDRALEEFDRIGRDAFLLKYGYGKARDYFLMTDTGRYDSKAIFGVAYGYQHGVPLGSDQFSGGRDGAAGRLAELGYSITGLSDLD
ncbi:tetratricopeptide repeat protein [Microbacterium sp. P5_E9]